MMEIARKAPFACIQRNGSVSWNRNEVVLSGSPQAVHI